jgi:hypothetical protein
VLCREFPTQSGPIDVLGTDFDAHPYIIETKLYKNPDKRLVLSQVLDYGAALWASEPDAREVIDHLRTDALKRNAQDPISALAAYLDADEQTANAHIERVCDALGAGRFTAIILMDHLSDRLRDLILFMNDNSSFRLLAVELEYYRHGETEIVHPRLFGSETKRPGKARGGRQTVGPEEYLKNYGVKFGEDAVEQWRSIAESAIAATGLAVGHRPGGCPYLYLQGTPAGDVRLFRLADAAAELRDLLHENEEVFGASAELDRARATFRQTLVNGIPGAFVGGGVGRVYIPLAAAAKHLSDLLQTISRFRASLEIVSPAGNGPAGT